MNEDLHLLVVAGETSSDGHGAKLIRELKALGIKVTAVGGEKMAAEADEFEENIVRKAAVGFTEVIRLIPFFIGLKNRIRDKYFLSGSGKKIDGAVCIDFPGCNLRLAKAAAAENVPIFYYILPQVWAWGRKRIRLMSNIFDRLYCVFDFEKELFEKTWGSIEFAGHPLLEDIPKNIDVDDFNRKNGISPEETLIALLPGSRKSEVQRHLPVMVSAVKGLGCRYILCKASSVEMELINEIAVGIEITEDIYGLLKRADCAVISSGTSTLEAAVLGTPFITVYRVSPVSYIIAKLLVNIPYITMVNILAGKQIVTELIQKDFNIERLRKELNVLLESPVKREEMSRQLVETAAKVGSRGASVRTARSLKERLSLKR